MNSSAYGPVHCLSFPVWDASINSKVSHILRYSSGLGALVRTCVWAIGSGEYGLEFLVDCHVFSNVVYLCSKMIIWAEVVGSC